MPTLYTFLRGPDGSHGRWHRSGTRRPIEWSWTDVDVWNMDVARSILEHRDSYARFLQCPAPRRKDESMETPTPVFYAAPGGRVFYGVPCPAGRVIDPMNDDAIPGYSWTPEALAELLRRRPDPAKAQAEFRQERNSYRDEVNEAHGILNKAGAKADGSRLPARISAYVAAMVSADLSASYGQRVLTEHLDKARADRAVLRAQLRDPIHLRAALASIDAKAARIAELETELATLKANE